MGAIGPRRALLAVLALLLGAGGVAFLVRYVRTSEDRALAGYELVDVYTVVEEIPVGTPAAELGERIQLTSIPSNNRSPDAVVELTELTDLVATVDLMPGEQLLVSRFDRPDEVRTVFGGTIEVPHGALEVTVQVASDRAIGGQISPGDVVAVLASIDAYVTPGTDAAPGAQPPATATQLDTGMSATGVLLRKVLVTNVQATTVDLFDQQDETGRTRAAPTVNLLVTLAVEPTDAARLVYANEYGRVWLARDTELAPDDATELVGQDQLFGGELTSAADDPAASSTTVPTTDTTAPAPASTTVPAAGATSAPAATTASTAAPTGGG